MPEAAGLSRRTSWDLAANALAGRLQELRARGRPLLDLSESNPTRCGLAWPADLLAAALAHPDVALYHPEPRGLPGAREAVSAYLASHGAAVDPDRVILTASTSEGYSLLLKLLCDPGDAVLAPAPSYPLLDVLCQLECVWLSRYPLRYDGTWHIDLAALEESATERTRAVVVVSPANPTGALLSGEELAALERFCARRGIALVGDEVFADTALGEKASVASARGALAFHLSGISKVCGLPQMKVAWIAAAGPGPEVERALERLEMISDAHLSVSGPSQLALPALLGGRERFLAPLRRRLEANRALLAQAVPGGAPFGPLRACGGWSAVLRMGEAVDEEALCLALLEDGVIVQPGFFYDFERKGHLVLSLLPEPEVFREGLARIARRFTSPRAWPQVHGTTEDLSEPNPLR
jgi:aspartate/methionine/tyrosine aminotransferase